MHWRKVTEDVIESTPDGHFRIVRSSRGFTVWERIPGQKKLQNAWKRIELPYETPEQAKLAACECAKELIQTNDRKSLACP